MRKKKKNSNKYKYFIPIFSSIILIIALIGTVINDWIQVIRNREEIKEVKLQYQKLLDEEASLNVEVSKLQDPDYIARYAREKYMYSKPGEIILRMVEPRENNKDDTVEGTN